MPIIKFIKPYGDELEVLAESGITVMQVAVDNGIDEIVAECGGACSCATCHCYVAEDWYTKLAAPNPIEKEMLHCVLNAQSNSRLSCQITLDDTLDGIVVYLPESQF